MNRSIAQIIGEVNPPPGVDKYGNLLSGGPTILISNLVKFAIVIAGLYAVINLITAGYGFMSAGGDPKKVAGASAKIWQTFIGLAVAGGAFILAAIIGQILFGNADALLQLRVFGPNL